MLERINQDRTGKEGVNAEGACVGLLWRKEQGLARSFSCRPNTGM